MTTFAVGSQVRLLSGSPTMTVCSATGTDPVYVVITTKWFDGALCHEGKFPAAALAPAPSEKASEKEKLIPPVSRKEPPMG